MTIYIFIDESGTLPDPKNNVIVLAGVATNLPKDLAKVLNSIKKRPNPNRKSQMKREIKFYTAGNRTRTGYLKLLRNLNVAIFALAVQKGRQIITDSPENYAVLSWLLLIDCFAYYKKEKIHLIFDRHFHNKTDERKFFLTLENLFGKPLSQETADSLKNPGITAADMVAGSILSFQINKNPEFYKLIEEKMTSLKIIHWKEAKKQFINAIKKLARTGVNTHPSENN